MSLHYDKNKSSDFSWLDEVNHKDFDSRAQNTINTIDTLGLTNSRRATRLLVNDMSKDKGYTRNDGRDYYVHPLAIAQTIIDFGIVSKLIEDGRKDSADDLIATALLHDTVEDIDFISVNFIREKFNDRIANNVDNLTKREGKESFVDYIKRVSTSPISAVVKILDRLNNLATLEQSSLEHRKQQYEETMAVYIPLTKYYRRQYWEYRGLFWQVRTIMISLLHEIKRANDFEEKLNKGELN